MKRLSQSFYHQSSGWVDSACTYPAFVFDALGAEERAAYDRFNVGAWEEVVDGVTSCCRAGDDDSGTVNAQSKNQIKVNEDSAVSL